MFIRGLVLLLSFYSVLGQLSLPGFTTTPPNGPCNTSTGETGICKPRRLCGRRNSAQDFSQQYCGFHNRQVHICCRTGTSSPLTKRNEVAAPKVNFQCGKRGAIKISFGFSPSFASSIVKRSAIPNKPSPIFDPAFINDYEVSIVGGHESFRNSWPWMALLGRKFGPRNIYFCSGSLINEQYVITAAHCVLDFETFFVRLGEHDQNIPSPSKQKPAEDINVVDVIFHPKYDIAQGYHDIAILKLARKVTFRNEIKPVCLPWGRAGNENLIKERVTVTGWGTEEFNGPSSNVLREVQINVFQPSVCHRSYSTLKDFAKAFPKGMNKKNIVCAGDEEGGKDACQGDSGGPMVHERSDSTYFLAGIISKGYGCGKKGFPGLYAPIRNYGTLKWIKRIAF